MNGRNGLPVDDKTLDRLVDGELDREEYQAVLRSLDQSPGQWRQCALAFLEAQAWKRELGAMRRDAEAPRATEVSRRPQRWSKHWPLLLAVAASFLMAFGLGLFFRPFSPATPDNATEQLAENAVPPTAPSRGTDRLRTVVPEAEPSGRSPDGNVMVMMDVGDGSGSHPVSVPVVDWSPQTDGMLRRGPTNVPSEVRRSLQQMGFELRLNRDFIRSETADGRPVVIPVEQFLMVPVGRRAYQ